MKNKRGVIALLAVLALFLFAGAVSAQGILCRTGTGSTVYHSPGADAVDCIVDTAQTIPAGTYNFNKLTNTHNLKNNESYINKRIII